MRVWECDSFGYGGYVTAVNWSLRQWFQDFLSGGFGDVDGVIKGRSLPRGRPLVTVHEFVWRKTRPFRTLKLL